VTHWQPTSAYYFSKPATSITIQAFLALSSVFLQCCQRIGVVHDVPSVVAPHLRRYPLQLKPGGRLNVSDMLSRRDYHFTESPQFWVSVKHAAHINVC